jgi:thiol-disulfide isomerase/thioredoxin
MSPVLYLLALVAAATTLGIVWKRSQGRVRQATGEAREFVTSGAKITLLQFSTEVCAPCAATRTVLEKIAEDSDAVSHVDLDVTHRSDLAARFNVLQTPTTLILDANGAVKARIGGAVRRDVITREVDRLLEIA